MLRLWLYVNQVQRSAQVPAWLYDIRSTGRPVIIMFIERDHVSFGLIGELSWLNPTKSLILSYEHSTPHNTPYISRILSGRSGPRFNVFDEDIRCERGWGDSHRGGKIGKSADQTKLIGFPALDCNKATLVSSENEPIRSASQSRIISGLCHIRRTAISLL